LLEAIADGLAHRIVDFSIPAISLRTRHVGFSTLLMLNRAQQIVFQQY
jgi:hypothetical protein